MKLKIVLGMALSFGLVACGGSSKPKKIATVSSKEKVEIKVKEVAKIVEKKKDFGLDKGVGPVKSIVLGDINESLVTQGKEVYKAKCSACHKIGKRFVGPALKGVTERRSPEWIMNMILNPEVMVVENETAKKLLEEYNAPMANQGLTEEEARAVLELLRTKN